MGQKLKINCATCDARSVREETLQGYDAVKINAAMLLVSPESRNLLGKYRVKVQCADVVELREGVSVNTVNGNTRIHGGAGRETQFLLINGTAQIMPDAAGTLGNYAGILVNGSVIYPESMAGEISEMRINGASIAYPDGAILLPRTAFIDATFAYRAKEALYWAQKRMIMVDPELSAETLKAKGARFACKEIILSRSNAEAMLEMIDERAQIRIVPDGTRVIDDDVTVNAGTIRRYGTKLCVLGDVTVGKDAADAVSKLEYLLVYGDVAVDAALEEALWSVPGEILGDVKVICGKRIAQNETVRISARLLQREADGVRVYQCEEVIIAPDVPEDLIESRLTIAQCEYVICAENQMDAVQSVCTDVEFIGTERPEQAESDSDGDWVKINAAQYAL